LHLEVQFEMHQFLLLATWQRLAQTASQDCFCAKAGADVSARPSAATITINFGISVLPKRTTTKPTVGPQIEPSRWALAPCRAQRQIESTGVGYAAGVELTPRDHRKALTQF